MINRQTKKSALALWPLAQVVCRMRMTIGAVSDGECYQIHYKSNAPKKTSFFRHDILWHVFTFYRIHRAEFFCARFTSWVLKSASDIDYSVVHSGIFNCKMCLAFFQVITFNFHRLELWLWWSVIVKSLVGSGYCCPHQSSCLIGNAVVKIHGVESSKRRFSLMPLLCNWWWSLTKM